ncbi:hypothetical protein D9M71_353470 [compost metagenome]
MPGHVEAPGERRRQAVPVQAVVPGQFAGADRYAAAGQVGGAGAGDAYHVGQRRGHQPGVGQGAGAQHQVDLAEVAAVQVDEAVDQAQLHVQAWVGHQEIGDGRGQVAAAERGGGVDADQAFGGVAQRHGFGPGQAQFLDDAPGPFGKGIARGRGAHGVGAAGEQTAAHGVFQVVDAPCYRRRGQRVATGGGRKAAGFQHIEEQAQLVGQGIGVHGCLAFAKNAQPLCAAVRFPASAHSLACSHYWYRRTRP